MSWPGKANGYGRGTKVYRLVRIVFVLLVAPSSLTLTATPAQACVCGTHNPREALAHSTSAFVGTVVVPSDDMTATVTVTIDVERVLKGELNEGRHEFDLGYSPGWQTTLRPAGAVTGVRMSRRDTALLAHARSTLLRGEPR